MCAGSGTCCADEGLRHRLGELLSPRTVIVGVGDRSRGEDGFGPGVVDALRGRVSIPVFDTGPTPENFLEPIVACGPSAVLFVDAAELGSAPGTLVLLTPEQLVVGGMSTHVTSLRVLADYLKLAAGVRSWALLAQPTRARPPAGDVDFCLSPPLRRAVLEVVELILAELAAAVRREVTVV